MTVSKIVGLQLIIYLVHMEVLSASNTWKLKKTSIFFRQKQVKWSFCY